MEKIKVILTIVSVIMLSQMCFSQDEPGDSNKTISLGITVDYNSRYMWRGMSLSEGSVIQPSGYISLKDINFAIWSNFDLKSSRSNRSLNEIDAIVTYPIELKSLSIEPSLLLYTYPYTHEQSSTLELGLKVTKSLLKYFSAYSTNNFEILRYPGVYYGELGLVYEKEITEKSKIGLSTGIGWSTSKFYTLYAGNSKSGFNAYFFNMFYNYDLNGGISFKPRLEFYSILNKQLQEISGSKLIVNFGITLSKDF
jgi:phage pi2 protein 07